MRNLFLFAAIAVLAGGASAKTTVSWKTVSMKREGWYSIKATYPVFKGGALADFASKQVASAALKRIETFRRETEQEGEKPRLPTEVEWKGVVSIANDQVISLYGYCFWFTGGAHPNRDYTTWNFGTFDGQPKAFGLGEIMKTRQAPTAFAWDVVLPRLRAAGASGVIDGGIENLSMQQANNFVVTPSGLTWIFAPYEMASYAEGEFFVKVPWSDMPGLNMTGPLAGLAK